MRSRISFVLVFLAALALGPLARPAAASCGSATCPIDPQSLNLPSAGQWTFDLSQQYIDQDRLRHGQHDVSGAEPPAEGELELRTVNRVTTFFANYAPTSELILSASLPYVSRYHEHFDSREFQTYHLDGAGDASVSARYRFLPFLWGGVAVKLPTGSRSSSNSEGDEAEPTIAPGTGSTDVSASVVFQTAANVPSLTYGPMGNTAALPLFLGITGRRNGTGTRDYRAGNELQINAGANYPVSQTFQVLFQLNYRAKTKDDVGKTDAVRDDTGGTFLYASPGLRVALSAHAAVYGYVQLPLYQRINGINIVSRYNLLGGVHIRL